MFKKLLFVVVTVLLAGCQNEDNEPVIVDEEKESIDYAVIGVHNGEVILANMEKPYTGLRCPTFLFPEVSANTITEAHDDEYSTADFQVVEIIPDGRIEPSGYISYEDDFPFAVNLKKEKVELTVYPVFMGDLIFYNISEEYYDE